MAQHLAQVARQNGEDAVLGRRQGHLVIAAPHLASRQIDAQLPGAEHGRLAERGALRPPEHRLHARQQFAHAEGLGHVVVRAQLQAAHDVKLGAPGSEHDDWHAGPLPQLGTESEAVHPRQHHVEQHQVGRAPRNRLQSRLGLDHTLHGVARVAQAALEDAPQRRVVVHQQHAGGSPCATGQQLRRGRRLILLIGKCRQHECEPRATTRRRVDPDAAAVGFDEGLADRQAEAAAAYVAGVGPRDLVETLEHPLALGGGDARPLVAHCDDHLAALALGLEPDQSPWRRELLRILQQVQQHLLDPSWVRTEQRQAAGDLDLNPRRAQALAVLPQQPLHQRQQRHQVAAQPQRAGLDLGEAEQVVDQLVESVALAVDQLQVLAPALRVGRCSAPQQRLGGALDRRQGCAQLVAHQRHKIRLEPLHLPQVPQILDYAHSTP